MDLLVIGGTGVLSLSVVKEAISQGISVTTINRGNRISEQPSGVRLIKADRNNHFLLRKALAGQYFDAIIDFLCYDVESLDESFSFFSNYTNQYIFISSAAVLDSRIGGILNEDSPKVLPMWEYSINKWACENKLIDLACRKGINYTIIRPAITYDDTRIPYGITPQYGYHWTLVGRILAGKPIIRWNQGKNRCNMMRVEDFSLGVIGLVGNQKAYGEAYNICGDETPTFNEVLNAMANCLGKSPVLFDLTSDEYAEMIPTRRGELLGGRSIDAIISNEKIKAIVPNFKQTICLKEGVQKTIDAYKERNFQRGIDWLFDAETDRIIAKFCKIKGIDTKPFNLGFVDYLGNATFKEKYRYWAEFNKEKLVAKILKRTNILLEFINNVVR